MLVDIEPGYEPLVLGEEIEARCRWIDASALPADLVSHDLQFSLTPWITGDGSPSKTESIGQCGPITALLKTPNPSARSVVVSGCLELFEEHTADFARGPFTLHQLRHSRLTHAAEDGASTPMLMRMSGHTSVRSLGKYARPSAEALMRWQAQTDPAARRR